MVKQIDFGALTSTLHTLSTWRGSARSISPSEAPAAQPDCLTLKAQCVSDVKALFSEQLGLSPNDVTVTPKIRDGQCAIEQSEGDIQLPAGVSIPEDKVEAINAAMRDPAFCRDMPVKRIPAPREK